MTDKAIPHNLVPEIALLAPLAPHLQSRFAKALQLMHQHLHQGISWEKIAIESAISPYHFHRQFKQLFMETPGQYHSRVRLQHAVNLLLSNQLKSVTDIAHQCGFSSSQALAKVLMRQLSITAKAIQKMAKRGTPNETSQLLDKLAHPREAQSFEHQLAEDMSTELIWYTKRSYKQLKVQDSDWDYLLTHYDEQVVDLVTLTPIEQLDQPWEQIDCFVGDWRCDKNLHDQEIKEGHFLCTEVLVATPTAYLSALETLFSLAKQQELDIDYRGQLLEFVLYADEVHGVVFSFQLPILD